MRPLDPSKRPCSLTIVSGTSWPMTSKIALMCACTTMLLGFAAPAQAQDYSLHYAQAGALLDYSNVQVKLLYASVTALEYDANTTKNTVAELKRSLGDAKRHAGRAATLLPEKMMKHEAQVEKLRAVISKAEDQLMKLATDIDEQTKALTAEDSEVELGERTDDEAVAPAQVDWDLLKKGTGWLGVDVSAARRLHKSVARKIKVKGLRSPPKPRGKRPE